METSNPFDFERPVKNPKLFAGRQSELDEIDYYLGLMLNENPTYHNLSIIGDRASGKTSFLNMVNYMAEKKKLLPTKISLNNEISNNEVFLFKEIFDSLITKGAEKGMFGGLSGTLYKLYRKAIDLLDAKAEIPFLFGTAYIGAKRNNTTTISQQVLLADLKKIFEEAKKVGIKGIVISLDECDLLSKNQTLLQKLRNVFSDIDGFMLVFSGTEKMFPSMTETFSPIPRIFKRIDLQNFKNLDETKDCIHKRLSKEEQLQINDGTIKEIHSITNGNPYEVQLVCHFVYKKFYENKTKTLELNTEVLDSVMHELDRLRKGGHHKIATQIKFCNPEQLDVLKNIIEFPNSTIDQLSRFILLSKLKKHDVNSIGKELSYQRSIINDLIDKTIKDEKGNLKFAGDQFDLLYLRYHLISNGIKKFLIGNPAEHDLNIHNKLTEQLVDDIEHYSNYTQFDEPYSDSLNTNSQGTKITFGGRFKPKPTAKKGEWSTIMTFSPDESSKKFHLGTENSKRFRVHCNFIPQKGFVTQYIFENNDDLNKFENNFQSLKSKLEFLGFEFILRDEIQLTLDGINFFKQKKYQDAFDCYNNAIKLNKKYELVWANKGHALFSMEKYDDAFYCYKEWCNLRPKLAGAWECMGKCCFHKSNFEEAFEYLDKASQFGPECWSVWDNRGRTLLNLQRFEDAINSFSKAIELKNDDYDAYLFRGICLTQVKREDEALKDFDTVLSSNPNHYVAMYNKAVALFQQKRNKESLTIFEKLGEKINNDILALNMLSLIHDSLDKLDNAINYCNKIIEKDPNFMTAWYNRSCFKVKLGQIEDGLKDLKKAFELDKKTVLDLLKEEKDFDSIRNDKRFQDLVSKHQS